MSVVQSGQDAEHPDTNSMANAAQSEPPVTTSVSELKPNLWELPLNAAIHSCKECTRRKAKCNRGLPTCSLCLKYHRHCLYEKHSKTPLTRKHLTEVEEKLQRAEALLKEAHRNGFLSRPSAASTSQDIVPDFDFSNLDVPTPGQTYVPTDTLYAYREQPVAASASLINVGVLNDAVATTPIPLPPKSMHVPEKLDNDDRSSNALETPPIDDYEWDESDLGYMLPTSQNKFSWVSSDTGYEESIIDGMGSLNIDERESGYLGVASGAALLRILDPTPSHSRPPRPPAWRPISTSSRIVEQPNPNRHILDSMIDSYFRLFHLSYPIIHEPTFRAQYYEIIPRPNGKAWMVLAHVLAAIGIFTTSSSSENMDLTLFAHAKTLLRIDLLESGSLTLVQALMLSANYIQKRNKPNSGYNYLGLALHMAMGLGLHKEFEGWSISPLNMEIRRRCWWTLSVFDIGATITFSRPLTWPESGAEVALPANIDDADLTAGSTTRPVPKDHATLCTSVRIHADFHIATNSIYKRIISKPVPSASELIALDDTLVESWLSRIPHYFSFDDNSSVPPKYKSTHYMLHLRHRNFRIIMYRPFVIRRALITSKPGRWKTDESVQSQLAYDRCLEEARITIALTEVFWRDNEHTRLAAWYALYFLFQAVLIPCICLKNSPDSPLSLVWQDQISSALSTIQALSDFNPSAIRCRQVIINLCGQLLQPETFFPVFEDYLPEQLPELSIGVSTESQLNEISREMWPNMMEADVLMQDDTWMKWLTDENEGTNWT